jgi:hypothetical protein
MEKKKAASWFVLNKTLRDGLIPTGQQNINEKRLETHVTIFSNDVLVPNIKIWSNTVLTNSSGQAIFYPTYDKTITGTAIFNTLAGVNAVASSGTNVASAIPYCSLKEINFSNKEVVVNVIVPQNISALGGTPATTCPSGVSVRCLLMGV